MSCPARCSIFSACVGSPVPATLALTCSWHFVFLQILPHLIHRYLLAAADHPIRFLLLPLFVYKGPLLFSFGRVLHSLPIPPPDDENWLRTTTPRTPRSRMLQDRAGSDLRHHSSVHHCSVFRWLACLLRASFLERCALTSSTSTHVPSRRTPCNSLQSKIHTAASFAFGPMHFISPLHSPQRSVWCPHGP